MTCDLLMSESFALEMGPQGELYLQCSGKGKLSLQVLNAQTICSVYLLLATIGGQISYLLEPTAQRI